VRIRYPESIVSQVRNLASTMTDLQIAAGIKTLRKGRGSKEPLLSSRIKAWRLSMRLVRYIWMLTLSTLGRLGCAWRP
jgi:hypothetical protein